MKSCFLPALPETKGPIVLEKNTQLLSLVTNKKRIAVQLAVPAIGCNESLNAPVLLHGVPGVVRESTRTLKENLLQEVPHQ